VRLSIRARLTLVSAVLVVGVLVAAGAFIYLRLDADLEDTVDAGLRSRADALLAASGELGEARLIEADEAFAQILGPEGDVLDASSVLGDGPMVDADELGPLPAFVEATVSTSDGPVPARILAVPVADGSVLLIGASVEDQEGALARLAVLMVLGGAAAVVLVVGVIWVVVGAALRPVEAMRAEAAAISASEPGRRLPVRESGDELARLGETLNAMLARLEESIERERRFVDDASHELRTPLANLKAELDLALRGSRDAEELESALRSASEETDRMARLAEDLLVLARADRGRLPVRRERVDVAELVNRAVEPFGARAAGRGVDLEARVPEDLAADLDEMRIAQALGNLVDNALRATPGGGRVVVEAFRDDGGLRLEVRDTGPGFPSTFLPSAFEAFARPDVSRARPDGGAGLGLAIVRAVAEAHGGVAEATNPPGGGASVVLTIPAGR
jgi:signal transduction histidine kinase